MLHKYFIPIFIALILLLTSVFLAKPIMQSINKFFYAPNTCVTPIYVFDIGSGASKSYKYHVDNCGVDIEKRIVDSKVVHLQYQHCISEYGQDTLSSHCIEQGKESIKQFEDYYGISCTDVSCFGVATAWARNASNANDIINFYHEAGIKLDIIDQHTEGELAYKAVLHSLKYIPYEISRDGLLVLDLGGGSHQISYEKDSIIKVISGQYGNANFYDTIVKHFGPDVFAQYGEQGYFKESAIQNIVQFGTQLVGENFNNNLDIEYKHVVGLGRTLYIYLNNNLKLGYIVTKEKIKEKILDLAHLSQQEAQQKYHLNNVPSFVPFMQSSLILIYCILDSLNIDVLYTVDVQITDAVLLEQLYLDANVQPDAHNDIMPITP